MFVQQPNSLSAKELTILTQNCFYGINVQQNEMVEIHKMTAYRSYMEYKKKK